MPTLHSHGPVPNSVPSGACHRIDGGSCREATRLRMYCIVLAVPVERKEKRTKKKTPNISQYLFGDAQNFWRTTTIITRTVHIKSSSATTAATATHQQQ